MTGRRGDRLRSDRPVALVGAGPAPEAALSACLARAGMAVAADGGARWLLAAGRMPDMVIGDLDSFEPGEVPQDRVLHVAGQDDTDLEKCLSRIDAPLVLGAGFLGGRIDHGLAAMNALAARAADGGRPCILVGEQDAAFALPSRLEIALPAGTRVSLFPMAPLRGRSDGLRWEIDGLDFAPWGRIGTSNRIADGRSGAVIAMDGPGMIGIVPAGHLDAVIAALAP